MPKAIRIHETGGPEVLTWEDVQVGDPGDGEVRLKHTAIGLNFIDMYQRSGLYPLASFPVILGAEGAGVIAAVGANVGDLQAGQRIAYSGAPGAYAEERILSTKNAVVLPDGIDEKTAAASMLKGMTACMLLKRVYQVQSGDTILVHAAAGGVGTILCQWAKHLGVTVIGTVGSDEKAAAAKAHGCDHAIVYTRDNFTEAVKEITGGEGVPVVYDSIGQDTFEGSLDCLKPRGMLVTFGAASGPIAPFDPLILMTKGSLYITRPTLFTYTAERDEMLELAGELFAVIEGGQVKIEINQTYALEEVAQAHTDLAARKTTGSTVLLP